MLLFAIFLLPTILAYIETGDDKSDNVFVYFARDTKFTDAVNICRGQDYSLAKVNDFETNWRLFLFANKVRTGWYWIDKSDEANEGVWVDSDGVDDGFKNWAPGEPNGGRGENCLHGNFYGNGLWNDISCTTNCAVICTVPRAKITDNDLMVLGRDMKFDDAQNVCAMNGFTVVYIDSEERNNQVFQFANKLQLGQYWIDLNDNMKEGTFVDSDGNEGQFFKWQPGEPNGGRNENCVHGNFYANGFWNDIPCSNTMSVICSK